MTKWTLMLVFWYHFHIQLIKSRNFCKRSFWIVGQEQVVPKWLNLWPNVQPFHFSEGICQFNWQNWKTFSKEVFGLEVRNRLWRNDLICYQMNTHFIFQMAYYYLIDQIEKLLQKKFLDWKSGTGCDEMT